MARRGSRDGASRVPRAPLDVPPWDDQDWPKARWPCRRGDRWPLFVLARVRLRRFRLDEQLGGGADPCSSAELARRAKELCKVKLRRRLSSDIERVVDEARTGAHYLTGSVPLNRDSVRLCQDSLLGLAQDLTSPGPVYARGVALVRLMLMDGGSLLYATSEPRQLEEEVRRARAALRLG